MISKDQRAGKAIRFGLSFLTPFLLSSLSSSQLEGRRSTHQNSFPIIMVVYILSRSKTRQSIETRHVDVELPRRQSESTPTNSNPTPPSLPRQQSRNSGVRFVTTASPSPLIPEEWMNSLVQYVAGLKKIAYDSSREDLAEAIKASIPFKLKQKVGKNNELTAAGILYGGQVTESVSAHQSLTHTMSMKRLERPSSAQQAFMDVQAHYMNSDTAKNYDDVAHTQKGRLEALKVNALMQQAKSLLAREKHERKMLVSAAWTLRTLTADFYEAEARSTLILEQEKGWNKIGACEVGEFLVCRKREQVNARSATIKKSAELLRGERDHLREETLALAKRLNAETQRSQTNVEQLTDIMLRELPMQPNSDSIDAEVARLILRDRRKPRTEYFPEFR